MKILMLTALVNRVGTWFRTFNLAVGLVERGHEVSVIKVAPDRRIVPRVTVESGVHIYDMPRFWGSSLLFHRGSRIPPDILARVGMQLTRDYDVVHSFTHHLNALLPAAVGGWLKRSSIVIGDRDDLWTDGGLHGNGNSGGPLRRLDYLFNSWTEKNMGRWLGAVTVVSDDLKDRELANGVDPRTIRKIINGCPVGQISPGDRAQARRILSLPGDRPVALFVGVGQYDVDMIMDATALYRSLGVPGPPPLTVLVGPHGPALQEIARQRGLGDLVTATDTITEQKLLAYLQAADVGLLPFADKPLNRARWPIKLGDYMAAGLPILTNRVGEMGRLVEEERMGEVTSPDAQSFAHGLARLLGDEPMRRLMGARARSAAERMSWNAVAGNLEDFYLELTAKRRAETNSPLGSDGDTSTVRPLSPPRDRERAVGA